MKSITTFYTKAKAHDLLAGFYDACAQVSPAGVRRLEERLRDGGLGVCKM